VQIRRELIDLARRYAGRRGRGCQHVARAELGHPGTSPRHRDAWGDSDDPVRLQNWTEFHDQIGALSSEEKEVVTLLWYRGLSQAEAARLLGVTERVVKYRWRSARLELRQRLGGRSPG